MTPAVSPITVHRLDAAQAQAAAPALAQVLLDCVAGGASVSFMADLSHERALAFWQGVAQGVAQHERALLVAQDAQGEVVGTVQLVLNLPDNQPHRADVAKMLVHRSARRQGVAQRLLTEVDAVARAEGRSVLVLDTVTGGDAERLYLRAGWQQVGVVPRYALMPDGRFCGTTFFHRQLGP